MRFASGIVVGVALAASVSVSEQQAAVELATGQPAPYAGVLIPEATYRQMAQATLDLPVAQAEIVAWRRGHALAIKSMEKALAALQQCEPRRSGIEKTLSTVKDVALLVLPLYCVTRDTTTTIETNPPQ